MRGALKQVAVLAVGVLVGATLFAARPGTSATASAAATASATPSAARGAGPLPGFSKAVFLSHVNDPKQTPLFPGDPKFTLTTAFTVPKDGFYLQYVKEGEHTGTHWGAPCHFHTNELCADKLSPADFFRPAVVIDVRRQSAANADFQVSVADLQRFEAAHGRIPADAAVIAWTGWGPKWGTPAYMNLDKQGNVHQPGFSIESVRWLLANRHIGALGTDTFGPDPGLDTQFRESSLIFHAHRIDLENMTGLEQLPATGGFIIVGGPRNRNGSGSPATIFGLVP